MRIFCLIFILIYGYFSSDAQQVEHIVKRGENFSSIAQLYSISELDLKKANSASSVCYIGRKLVIPLGRTSNEPPLLVEPQVFDLRSTDSTVITKKKVTSYQVGQALWCHHKYEAATVYLLDAAEQGETRAFYPLADCFSNKESSSFSEKDAVFWLLKSAKVNNKSLEGYWQSCRILAHRYQSGNGVKKDLSEARKYCSEYLRYAPQYEKRTAKKLLNEIAEEQKKLSTAEKRRSEESDDKRKQHQVSSTNSIRPSMEDIYSISNITLQKSAEKQSTVIQNKPHPRTYRTLLGETTFYPQDNGTSKTYSKTVCGYCHGTKVCSGCQYAIMVQSVVPYNFICPMCGGTRVCPKCSGKGYTESWGCVDGTGTGYMIGDDGHVYSTGSGVSSSSRKDTSNPYSKSKSSVCPDCGGKGYRPESYTYAAPSSFSPHHNNHGVSCFICGQETDHYHYRCTTCKRR